MKSSAHDNTTETNAELLKERGLFKALVAVTFVLCAMLLMGTVYSLLSGSRSSVRIYTEPDSREAATDVSIFDALGQIRATTSDDKPAVVVATLSFPYGKSDREFYEELMSKKSELKTTCEKLLSGKKAEGLHPAFLGQIRAELRDAINSRLSLGKIETVYIGEFSVIH